MLISYCESVNLKQVKWTEKKCNICKLSIGLTIKVNLLNSSVNMEIVINISM